MFRAPAREAQATYPPASGGGGELIPGKQRRNVAAFGDQMRGGGGTGWGGFIAVDLDKKFNLAET